MGYCSQWTCPLVWQNSIIYWPFFCPSPVPSLMGNMLMLLEVFLVLDEMVLEVCLGIVDHSIWLPYSEVPHVLHCVYDDTMHNMYDMNLYHRIFFLQWHGLLSLRAIKLGSRVACLNFRTGTGGFCWKKGLFLISSSIVDKGVPRGQELWRICSSQFGAWRVSDRHHQTLQGVVFWGSSWWTWFFHIDRVTPCDTKLCSIHPREGSMSRLGGYVLDQVGGWK